MKIYRDWCDVPIVLTTEIAADITGEYVKPYHVFAGREKSKPLGAGKDGLFLKNH